MNGHTMLNNVMLANLVRVHINHWAHSLSQLVCVVIQSVTCDNVLLKSSKGEQFVWT